MKGKLIKRILATCVMVSTTTCMMAGCGAEAGTASTGGKLVKISCVVSSSQPATVAVKEVFKKRIEELTNGRYNIEVYDSGVLGSDQVSYSYTKSGVVEMCVVGTPMWSESPIMSVPDFPFVYRDVEHARHCYQGEVGEYIADTLETEQPVKLLSWFPNGSRVFSSSQPLTSVEEFQGLKIRMPNNPIHVRLAESLGANVVIMDMGEVFTALEQGVADGQDNPLSTVKNEGWYEVQDYIYETNHIISSLELIASEEFWNDLPEEDKAIFEQVSQETSDYAWDLYMEQLASDEQFMIDNGLTVTKVTEEDQAEIREKIQPVYDYLYERYDWADDIIQMIQEVE